MKCVVIQVWVELMLLKYDLYHDDLGHTNRTVCLAKTDQFYKTAFRVCIMSALKK